MNSKRILSMVLAMVLLCSNVLAAPISGVKDIPTWWSKEAVEQAVENDVLTANNNLIRPMAKLTRAEMAQGITNAFGATKKADLSSYTDVPKNRWYYEDMQEAVAMGIITGYGNGLIKPEKKITREEMFTVIYNALELEGGNVYLLNKFNDRNLVSDWAEKVVARMVENRYVVGNAKGNLKPTESITREEFAQVMKNIFAGYYSTPGTYTNVPEGNIIISTPNVILKDTTVKGDLIIADGVGSGEVTLDNVEVHGRTLVRGGGENSIKLINNTSLSGKLIVNNNIGKVRIYNSKSKVRNVEVKTPIILEGEFGNVEVVKSTQVETKGDINNLVVNEKADVKVTSGEIKQVQVKDTAAKTTIAGEGKVTQVNANANDVTITVPKAKVTVAENVTGVVAGKTEVKPGKTETVKDTSSTSGKGGGGGGSSSGGGGGGSSTSSKVTLVYNANGGNGAPNTQTYSGKNYTFTVSTVKPTREGYTFLGWADSVTATSANITSTVYVSSGTKTIYAVWSVNKYTVTWKNEDGKVLETDTDVAKGTMPTYDGATPEKASTAEYTYTFKGWDPEISAVKGDATYTAQYTATKNTYTVTWKNDDGSVLRTDTVEYGTTPSYAGIPTKEGYTFAGWYSDEGFTTIYNFDQVTGNITIYAKWTLNQNGTVTLRYDFNDGTGTIEDQTYTLTGTETSHTFEISSTVPAREGYTFLGWADTNNASEPNITTSTVEVSSASKVIYAIWKANTYKVTFDVDGGSDVAEQTVVHGNKASRPADPTKGGYTFAGWYSDETLTTEYNFDSAVTGNITIYAKWTLNQNGTVMLRYDLNGGTGTIEDQTYTLTGTETSHTFEISSTVPAREGYTFLGWADTNNASEPNITTSTVEVSSASKVIYAIWKANTYKVTFDVDGGSDVAEQTVVHGNKASRPADPTKGGYTFAGWYSDETLTTEYNFDNEVKEDVTLHAAWRCNICSKINCVTNHRYCEICDEYDCEITHTTCELCGETDCTLQHEKYGDVDGKEGITEEDAEFLLNYTFMSEEEKEEYKGQVDIYGDVDSDEEITANDVVLLQKYLFSNININVLPHKHNYGGDAICDECFFTNGDEAHGYINKDDIIDENDVDLLNRYIADPETYKDQVIDNINIFGDVNANGKLDNEDVIMLHNIVQGHVRNVLPHKHVYNTAGECNCGLKEGALYGDIDGDGIVTDSDYQLVFYYYMFVVQAKEEEKEEKKEEYKEQHKEELVVDIDIYGDVNLNGIIDDNDCEMILFYFMGQQKELPHKHIEDNDVRCECRSYKAPKYGDINGDGTVNKDDEDLLMMYMSYPETYKNQVIEDINIYGDVNKDGELNKEDAIMLHERIMRRVSYLPHIHKYSGGECIFQDDALEGAKYGDINGDGNVTTDDSSLLREYIASPAENENLIKTCIDIYGDVDLDGELTEDDAKIIDFHIRGEHSEFAELPYIMRGKAILIYDANGGSGAPEKEEHILNGLETGHIFTIIDVEPTLDGYNFAGWNTKQDGTGESYTKGEELSFKHETITLYAMWNSIPAHAHTYEDGVCTECNYNCVHPEQNQDKIENPYFYEDIPYHSFITKCNECGESLEETEGVECTFGDVWYASNENGTHNIMRRCIYCGREDGQEEECNKDGEKRYEAIEGVGNHNTYCICTLCKAEWMYEEGCEWANGEYISTGDGLTHEYRVICKSCEKEDTQLGDCIFDEETGVCIACKGEVELYTIMIYCCADEMNCVMSSVMEKSQTAFIVSISSIVPEGCSFGSGEIKPYTDDGVGLETNESELFLTIAEDSPDVITIYLY